MRRLAGIMVAFVAGCGGGGAMQVGPSSVPSGDGSGMGTPSPGGGMPGGGGGGGGMPGGGGGGGGAGGGGGGSGGGGAGGGGSGGSGGGSGGGGGAACDLSAPTAIVRGVNDLRAIAVDADFVYYVDNQPDHVVTYRVAKSGGTATALVTLPPRDGSDVAVDDTNVYVLESGTPPGIAGIHILSKPSGAERFVRAVPLAASCDEPHPIRLATFGGDVYWTQFDAAANGCSAGAELDRLPRGSDTPVELFAADEDDYGAVFVDATHVFWFGGAGIWREDHDGRNGGRLDPHFASFFASDGNTLYAGADHSVYAITAPSVDHLLYEDPSAAITGLWGDATHVWIAASHLVRIDLPSGAPVVVSDAPALGPVAVDDRYVYYFDRANEILKACR